jgi:predicted DNA-binding protein (UPF0251 family)
MKCRRVEHEPEYTCFKPAGVPQRDLDEVILTVEELEAIRLKDMENLEQEDCAERMQVSRPTFVRILNSARAKIADALLRGKMLKVEGGNYRLATSWLRCKACAYEFEIPLSRLQQVEKAVCPRCQGQELEEQNCRKQGHNHKHRRCRRGWQSEYKEH